MFFFGLEPFNFDEFDVYFILLLLNQVLIYATTHAKPEYLLPLLILCPFFLLTFFSKSLSLSTEWNWLFFYSFAYIFHGTNTVEFICYCYYRTKYVYMYVVCIHAFNHLLVRRYLSRNRWFLNIWCIVLLSFLLPHSSSCRHHSHPWLSFQIKLFTVFVCFQIKWFAYSLENLYIVAHCRKHYWIKYHVFAFDRFKKCEMLSRNVSFALWVIGIFILSLHFTVHIILFVQRIYLPVFLSFFSLSMWTSFIIVIGILYVHVLLYDNQCIQCV